jgi:hypothetical protein
MKRILVPIAMLRSEEERVVRILRSMGRERVEFRGFSPESEAEVSRPMEPIAKRGLIVDVPDDMSLPWVERMVEHALSDADLLAVLSRLRTLG